MKIAGIDLGGTTIKFGIFDDDLRILHKWSCPTPAKASDAAARMAAEIFPFGPDVVGISAAGTVAGGLVTANNLSWTDEPLAALVHEAVGLPTTIINDGHAALQAELHGGALQGVQTGLLLTLGTGIGGGIVLNGQCWLSPTGLAPELGHTITHADGLTCSCGQCGCYEKYASATALRRMADGEEPVELIDRAKRGQFVKEPHHQAAQQPSAASKIQKYFPKACKQRRFHAQFASFFRFMAANLSLTHCVTRARPLMWV